MAFVRVAARFLGSLILLVGLLIAGAAGMRWMLRYVFDGVSPTVAAAIVAAAATGLLSLATVVFQRRAERRQAIEHEIRTRKIEVYSRLLAHFFDIFGLGKDRTDEEAQAAIAAAMAELGAMTPELISWASDPVLLAWSRYRRSITSPNDPLSMMLGFEVVLFAIRQDLGHSNKDFRPGDLLALWVNDIDDFLGDQPPVAAT
jgi:hypothetical protein